MFEIGMLIADSPHRLSSMMSIGNYAGLCGLQGLPCRFFRNSIDYYIELGRWICKFAKSDPYPFTTEHIETAIMVFYFIFIICC